MSGLSAKHLFQQIRTAGNGILADGLLFLGQFVEQAVQGFLCDIGVQIQRTAATEQSAPALAVSCL